jgi:glycosyltransferase involved in cell wall biosynthesis
MMVEELSVFFPAYNEEANIKETVTEAVAVLEKIAQKWEVIVINDGSTDSTGEIVEKLITQEKRIRMITHTPNRGYGAAIKSGLDHSRYNLIAFTDADGQFDFAEITKFLEAIKEADLVAGYRPVREDSKLRILNAKLWEFLLKAMFGLKVKDPDCGFKLMKKTVVEKIGPLSTESAVTEPELLVRAQRAGFKIRQIEVSHYPRRQGKQTGANLKVITKALKEAFGLWFALRK